MPGKANGGELIGGRRREGSDFTCDSVRYPGSQVAGERCVCLGAVVCLGAGEGKTARLPQKGGGRKAEKRDTFCPSDVNSEQEK